MSIRTYEETVCDLCKEKITSNHFEVSTIRQGKQGKHVCSGCKEKFIRSILIVGLDYRMYPCTREDIQTISVSGPQDV